MRWWHVNVDGDDVDLTQWHHLHAGVLHEGRRPHATRGHILWKVAEVEHARRLQIEITHLWVSVFLESVFHQGSCKL